MAVTDLQDGLQVDAVPFQGQLYGLRPHEQGGCAVGIKDRCGDDGFFPLVQENLGNEPDPFFSPVAEDQVVVIHIQKGCHLFPQVPAQASGYRLHPVIAAATA